MFTKYNLFLGADGKWHPANHIYLDRPYAIMMVMFVDIRGNELEVVLAQRDEIIYFTKTHVADIKTVIEVDSSLDCEISIDDDEVT